VCVYVHVCGVCVLCVGNVTVCVLCVGNVTVCVLCVGNVTVCFISDYPCDVSGFISDFPFNGI